MSLINTTTLLLFVALFMPGFIYIKVRGAIRATDKVDFSKSWYDAAGYGCVFFLFAALLTFIVITIHPLELQYDMALFLALLLALPVIAAFLIGSFYKLSIIHDHFILPDESAWDYIFSRRKSYWVIVHLKNGKTLAGIYSDKSYSSAYPRKKDIYLESEWTTTLTGRFVDEYTATNGIWIPEEQIAYVRFFKYPQQKMLITRLISLKHRVRRFRHQYKGFLPFIRRQIKSWQITRIIRGIVMALQCKDHQ